MQTLRCHPEMIRLNPLVLDFHPTRPPPSATPEEYHCKWYEITDRVDYLPGGRMSGKVSYTACFHDLANGLQVHSYAPMGVNIKSKWLLGGSLPGEPIAPTELGIGAPLQGLYIREDTEFKCNIVMTSFIRKTLTKAHGKLVEHFLFKAHLDNGASNQLGEALSPVPHDLSLRYQPSYSWGTAIDEELQAMGTDNRPYTMYSRSNLVSNNSNTPPASRKPDLPDFRDKTTYDDDPLCPRPLSFRTSGSSAGLSTFQEPGDSNQRDMGPWQFVTPLKPMPQPIRGAPAIPKGQPYDMRLRPQSLIKSEPSIWDGPGGIE
jgi:hypothetical protein